MSANAGLEEVVDRNVKALLKRLTTEDFDSISSQIIQWANGSENQKDGRTLLQIVRLVFENATKETSLSEMYARLCRRIMEQINPNIRDEGITNAEGKPIPGAQLFRKYLINRCQEAFEGLGAVAKDSPAAATDATKAAEENAAALTSKRRGPALTKFLGELFKLHMLTERIMHACIKKLLGDSNHPKEEEMESLCELMTTVGSFLDTPRGRAHMDVHFQRMKEVAQNPSITVRLWLMLQEVFQLRERKWVARDVAAAGPSRLTEETAVVPQRISISRSAQSGISQDYLQADGWTVTGNSSRTPARAGDLSQFGEAQTNSSPTMSPQEHREQFQRTRLMHHESITPPAQTEMNEEAADTKITEYVKRFFDSRNLDEAESFFSTLPSQYHHTLVNNLVASVIKPKEPDARLVADLFTRARSKGLCSPDALEDGLTPTVDMIKDISIDSSKAWSLFATMANGAQLDEEHRTRLAAKLLDGNEFLGFLSP